MAASAAVTSITAGCEWDDPAVPNRSLGLRPLDFNRTDSGYVFTFEAQFYISGGNESFRKFHNVSLNGYNEHDKIICKKRIGDIDFTNETSLRDIRQEVNLTCPELPETIRYTATETPCDKDTHRDYYRIEGMRNGKPVYSENRESCNQTKYSTFESDGYNQ